jgi:hypothetical protein
MPVGERQGKPADSLSGQIRPYPGKSDHTNGKQRNPGRHVVDGSNWVKVGQT